MINSTFNSILLYPRFNSKSYSIQNISQFQNNLLIQFNSQGIMDTGRIGKVPKKCPKRQKKGGTFLQKRQISIQNTIY